MLRSLRTLQLLWLWTALVAAYPNANTFKQSNQPTYTYLTTSSTSSQRNDAAAMQPAIVYEAAVPTQEEEQHYVSPLSSSTSAPSSTTGEASKKVIGSSVVPSVSVVLDGNEPHYADALGHKVPKPQPSLQVASPIDLLNPDRYEFYTFDEHGELVKRLMTMQEIQSIVANGDGEGPSIIHTSSLQPQEPERKVQDIVNSVQNVLNKEVASSSAKNSSVELLPVLDTPDVSSSWSLILPAIFGNTGGDIFPQQKPHQIVMTPDSEILDTSTKAAPALQRPSKKPKPAKRKPSNKRKPSTTKSTTEMTPQVVQEELDPMESVYTGIQQYQQAAANIQNFDMLQIQPIYQKLPNTTAKIETTTRRVFYNNQEIVQTPTTEGITSQLAKKPGNGQRKPTQSHRVKKPNGGTGSSNSTSQHTGSKQKNKKKPASGTSTTSAISPSIISAVTSTTEAAESLVPEAATTTNRPTVPTTPKKKKRKPTRTPTETTSGNKPGKPKRKPTAKPKPVHQTGQQTVEGSPSQHQVVNASKPTQTQRPKKKPKPTTTTTPAPTTTTTVPLPETVTEGIESQPEPTSSTTITTTESSTIDSAATTKRSPALHHHKLQSKPTSKRPTTLHHNKIHTKPVHNLSTTESAVTPTSQILPEPEVYVNIVPLKSPTTTTSTTHAPAYPVPSYNAEATDNLPTVVTYDDKMSLKQSPLPSLAMLQQQLQQSAVPTPSVPQLTADQILSMDQIVQSLTQGIQQADKKTESPAQVVEPIKYDSAYSKEQMQTLANKKKITVVSTTTTVQPTVVSTTTRATTSTTTTTTPKSTTIVNTQRPLTAHYGGSTLATMLDEENTSGSDELTDSTESSGIKVLQTTHSSTETDIKEQTPIVLITARPQYFTITKAPTQWESLQTVYTEKSNEEPETTELPYNTQFLLTTPMATYEDMDSETEVEATTIKPVADADQVVKVEPLYVDVPEAVVADISKQTETTTINSYHQDQISSETTTELIARLPVSESTTVVDDDSTEVTPMIANLVQQLNLDVLKPKDQISMSNFQTQAATVASTLVDGSNTLVSDVSMSSNETKDELEFLMSDVIQQITHDDSYKLPSQADDSHRLTSFAQLNTSFLMSGTKKKQPLPQKPLYDEQKITTISPTEQYSTAPEITTIIPSNEELIKQEADYLNALPPSNVESTTFKVPVLSLSQIYAQQQQDEDNELQRFEQQRLEVSSTIKPTFANQEATLQDKNDDREEPEKEQTISTLSHYGTEPAVSTVITTEQHLQSQDSKVTIASEETTMSVPDQLYGEKPDNNYTEHDSEEQMPEMLTNGYADQIQAEGTEVFTTDKLEEAQTQVPESVERTTTEITTTSAAAESTNIYQDVQEQTSTEQEEQKTERSEEVQIDEKTQSGEDSTANAAQLLSQYTTQLVEEQTKSDSKEQSTLVGEELATEIPGDMTVVSSESDMSLSSEQVTESLDVSTVKTLELNEEAVEDVSDELTAAITEEDNTSSQKYHIDDEDPYVKLGETTASIVKPQYTGNDEDVSTLKSNELNKSQEQEQNYKVTLPLASYDKQATENSDDEDEEDQSFYQLPVVPPSSTTTTTTKRTTTSTTTSLPITNVTTKRLHTLKPVSYYVQPSLLGGYNQLEPQPPKGLPYNANSVGQQQRPTQRPASLTNLMHASTQVTRPPVKLEPSPLSSQGLEASTVRLDEDVLSFARLCNELAFSYWKAITSEKISSARSLVISPFALTSMLSMVFLGARGSTSGEMNEILKLDDMITFNPHLIFKNITSSVEQAMEGEIATAAFVREIFSDRANGKILPFFKEKTQQLYSGHVEEVNFHVVNDIVRRRTNLLVKRHTMGKVLEYLRTNSVWVNGPLATVSANLFQTDCSRGSTTDRDGEMFFQVHPTVRQRRLVPIPAVLYRSGFTAGYEPKLDATVVAFGRIQDTVSTIYVMPGHQSSVSPTDNLDRLERNLVELAFSKENAWSHLLTSLMDRPGMEVQLPRFSHRSFVNASLGLQKMGLKGLFKSDFADLRGLTGAGNREVFLSDMTQINTFSTCGEEKISDHHHVEMYPAPPLRKRNKDVDATDDDAYDSSEAIVDFGSLVQESALGRGFYDDLLDPKYLELPLPLRPRQARVPDAPRLRFDKPFFYFVRHNPTGMILFMGRFNPRLLP